MNGRLSAATLARNQRCRDWVASQVGDPAEVVQVQRFVRQVLGPAAREHGLRFYRGDNAAAEMRNATGSLRRFMQGESVVGWILDLIEAARADTETVEAPEDSFAELLRVVREIEAGLRDTNERLDGILGELRADGGPQLALARAE